MKKSILTMLACAFATLAMAQAKPILTIEGGKVQGVSTDIEGVTVYRGIPYAAAPIGDLRWKAPQPVVAWEGVKVADKFGHPGYSRCIILAAIPLSGAMATNRLTARTVLLPAVFSTRLSS